MLKIKESVKLLGVRPEILIALMVSERACAKYNVDCVLTSAVDGKHSRGSLHYKGIAIDIRTRDLVERDKQGLAQLIAESLGPSYDVVLEPTHIHIEYDPDN